MVGTPRHLLIVDNTTTCAMRIKTLFHIHGAKAKLIQWSEWDKQSINETENLPCVLIVEQTVPLHIVRSLINTLPNIPLFILFNPNKPLVHWPIKSQINPLSSALSNVELVAIVQPYWTDDKVIRLPNVVTIDASSTSGFHVMNTLSRAHIPSTLINEVNLALLDSVDLILINITENESRLAQLESIKKAYPLVGVIAYGDPELLSNFTFLQRAIKLGVNEIIDIEKLDDNWLFSFHSVWQQTSEIKENQRVLANIQQSFDRLLEKSLMSEVLMANSLDGIVALNEDGIILKNNDGFCELLGLIDAQVKRANLFSLISQQSKKHLQKLINRDYLSKQQFIELNLLHEHGVSICVSASVNRINVDGQYVYILVMRNNVNQQLQKTILVQQNAQLEHRIKEVVSQKELLLELTRKNNRKQTMFMQYFTRYLLEQSHTENQLSTEVMHKLHNLNMICKLQADQEPINIQPINLRQIIKLTLDILDDAICAKNLSVINDIDTEIEVNFTEAHIKIIIYELLHNAVTYNLPSGSILLTTRYHPDQRVQLKVADTGLGVVEHKQLRLFHLQELNDGSNIDVCCTGLALSKSLAKFNLADVYVDNNYHDTKVTGSIFSLSMSIDKKNKIN